MQVEPAPRWYAAQCLSHRERGAHSHLRNQNFEVFLPCREKTRRHARKIETVLRPFFPGYLFVKLDLSRDRWRSVNGTYGVASLVMNGDAPLPIPHGVVEALQRTCDTRDVIAWEPVLQPGQNVRILNGAFADLVGVLDSLDGAGRVRVLLNIMGGEVPAVLLRGSVEPASCAF